MPTRTSPGCARGSMTSLPDSFQQIYSFMTPSLSPVSTGRNPHRWPAVRQSAPLLAWLLLALCEPAVGAEQTLPISIADGPPFSIIRGDKLLEAAKGARIQA